MATLGNLVADPDGLAARFDAAVRVDDILAGKVRAETLVLNLMNAFDGLQAAPG